MILAHAGDHYDDNLGAIAPPIFLTSVHKCDSIENYYHQRDGQYVYSRYSNPNITLLETKVAALEHGKHCLAYANGMAAASAAILALAKPGGHILCVHNAYNCVQQLLREYCGPVLGIETTFVHGYDFDELQGAIRENTFLMILESPGSSTMTLVDLRRVSALAKAHGIATYIDNTYCTPLHQKPLELGIDLVMHTATKYMGGHSDVLGGLLVTNEEALADRLRQLRPLFGGILSPMDAWLITRGLRTMEVRLRAHEEAAMQVAKALERHPRVRKVYYPGLESHPQHALALAQQTGNCGLLSFEIDGTPEEAAAVVNRLKVFTIGPSWGGFESLVVMPLYSMTEEEAAWYGASRGLIRIHCGLEGADALLRDLEQALIPGDG